IRGLARPLGWSARELELAAVVARYHRGALPRPGGKTMQALALPDRPLAMELAGVLRLANALDLRHGRGRGENESAPRLEVSLQDGCVLVRAAGYSALDRSAEGRAAAAGAGAGVAESGEQQFRKARRQLSAIANSMVAAATSSCRAGLGSDGAKPRPHTIP